MDNKLEVTFTGNALDQIKQLQKYFSISDNEMKNVLIKGIQVLNEIKKPGNTFFVTVDKEGKRERIDMLHL